MSWLATHAPPPALVEEVIAGNCVAFVGAGFSAAARLPGWHALLRRVAGIDGDECPIGDAAIEDLLRAEHLSSRQLEMAAQLLQDALEGEVDGDQPAFQARIERCLRSTDPGPVMRRRLEHLRGIPFKAVVTTNFDPLLHGVGPTPENLRRLLRAPRSSPWHQALFGVDRELAGPEDWAVPVVQLHGGVHLKHPDLVFTRSQYRERLYGSPGYLTVLRSLLATSTVLFLGYSLTDAYLNELRAELVETFRDRGGAPPGDPLAWAILSDVTPAEEAYFRRHEGLGVLGFVVGRSPDDPPDFSGFDALLGQIHAATNPITQLGARLRHRDGRPRRILWLDRQPDTRAFAKGVWRRALREVGGADLGEHLVEVDRLAEALDQLDTSAFDLVLTHFGHRPDGPSTAEKLLRATAERRAVGRLMPPVLVFASGDYADENRRRSLFAGAVGYTCTWEGLMEAVDLVLA